MPSVCVIVCQRWHKSLDSVSLSEVHIIVFLRHHVPISFIGSIERYTSLLPELAGNLPWHAASYTTTIFHCHLAMYLCIYNGPNKGHIRNNGQKAMVCYSESLLYICSRCMRMLTMILIMFEIDKIVNIKSTHMCTIENGGRFLRYQVYFI